MISKALSLFDPQPEAPRGITLRCAYEQYKHTSRDEPRTVEAYDNALKLWELISGNPAVQSITVDTLEEFREAFLQHPGLREDRETPLRVTTLHKVWSHLSAILNRCAPQAIGNPLGRGLIDFVPYLELPKVDDPEPRAATLEEMSAIYQSCETATWPTTNPDIAPPDWWRALTVWLFNMVSRRNDFKALAWPEIDLEKRVVLRQSGKSRKRRMKPLHPTVVTHLMLIRGDFLCHGKPLVFPMSKAPRMMYEQWYRIQLVAGIPHEDRYKFHEMRSTGLSYYYERSPGGAQEMAEHSDLKTTRRHYFAPSQHLRELVDTHPQPAAFLED